MGVITLTTDFGLSDSYVAQMKGVMLSIAPESSLIDLTHSIAPCDIASAARVLAESAGYYPDGTIHLAVVDPGVGGARRRIIIQAAVRTEIDVRPKRAYFVGPDNGIFALAAPALARERVWEIQNHHRLPRFESGRTFDGRNVFAPVAAMLSNGVPASELGSEIATPLVEAEIHAQPIKVDGILKGHVVYFDHFGNAATNITKSQLGAGKVIVSLPKQSLTLDLRQSFEDFRTGEPGCIINSQGCVEIVANQQSARKLLALDAGDPVHITIG
ncbi:MAG: SAM-dependent chlorinase/fluorinase [Bdellovibrionota bacterium]